MKLASKNENEKARVRMDRDDWLRIGQDAGWKVPDEIIESDDVPADPKFKIEVKQYGPSDFWIFVNEELLAILKHTKREMD